MITKTGIFSVVGRPNVGKSTLTNALCGSKVAIVSDKPQTTRTRITGVLNRDDCQMIFLDTPGLHKPKTRLGDYMVKVVTDTVTDVDTVLLLVEPVARIGIPEQMLLDKIKEYDLPAVLVINKIDTVEKDALAQAIEAYRNVCEFAEIVPVSALRAKNLDKLLELIYQYLPFGPMYYDEDTVTEQPMREIAAELIREKALRLLKDEVPHGIAVEILSMKERKNGIVDIEANIMCERESHKGIVIGKGGSMLKRIGSSARYEIEKMMEMKVNLQLWVKVRKEWRDNDLILRDFGYHSKDI